MLSVEIAVVWLALTELSALLFLRSGASGDHYFVRHCCVFARSFDQHYARFALAHFYRLCFLRELAGPGLSADPLNIVSLEN
jgi:hypothetical protein